MMTELLTEAGLPLGARVLDVGCGAGIISQLVAQLVGPSGNVVGIDANPAALDRARSAASIAGHANIDFVAHELSPSPVSAAALAALGSFDAVVGRRVLMYLPDLPRVFRSLVEVLRPGGLLAFVEMDETMIRPLPTAFPLHDQVTRWIRETLEREGANRHMGYDLPRLFETAELQIGGVRGEAAFEGHNTSLAAIARAMLPRMVAHGVVSAAEGDLDNLEARLRAERPAHELYLQTMQVGIWGRRPERTDWDLTTGELMPIG